MKTADRATAIWWIRRDLRLKNNSALNTAIQAGYSVLPVFVIDPVIENSSRMSKNRMDFLRGGLLNLEKKIQEAGGEMVLRRGQPVKILNEIFKESGALRIYAETDLTPYALRRDNQVSESLPLELVPGVTYSPPDQIAANSGDPYQVYSYYRKKWKKINLEALRTLQLDNPAPEFSAPGLVSEELEQPVQPDLEMDFTPSEENARIRLREFSAGQNAPVYDYQVQRNQPDLDGTSRLSPYLHFGMISIREVFQAALEAMDRAQNQRQLQSAETWLDELIWREFYHYILFHHPRVLKQSYRKELAGIPWRNARDELMRWKAGKTGYPIVDAAMRQLQTTNWMHNRSRMITASFLVKDLLIDWRWGEDWFMKNLLDADLANNNGGWQWVAGTGTDAAPYFRIFNPTTQAEKHDPNGSYIRKYVPELERVPDSYIHQPWKMPEKVQKEADCVIGKDYPPPMVDHAEARLRTLEAYQWAREQHL